METGDMYRQLGFSFSHTLGMGEVLLKSPLSVLSRSFRPGSRTGSAAGGGTNRSYKFGWSSARAASPLGMASTTNAAASPTQSPGSTSPLPPTSPVSERQPRVSITLPGSTENVQPRLTASPSNLAVITDPDELKGLPPKSETK
jgi:hypothetical protein